MPDISGISGANSPDPVRNKAGVNRNGTRRNDSKSGVEDSVEISTEGSRKAEAAEFVAKLKEIPEVRQARIDQIKQEIQDGTYDIEAKLSGAIDGLLGDMRIGHIQ